MPTRKDTTIFFFFLNTIRQYKKERVFFKYFCVNRNVVLTNVILISDHSVFREKRLRRPYHTRRPDW